MILRPLWPILLALGLAACAGPRWQTVYQYEPPAGGTGTACAQGCAERLQSCRMDCEDRHQQCLRSAEIAAREGFDLLLEEHEREMRFYHLDLVVYETARHRHQHLRHRLEHDQREYAGRCKANPKDRTACELAERARRELRELALHRPHAPLRPEAPSLGEEIARAQAHCSRDCGCIETYNACYAACGGRVIPQQRCIDNCPEGVPRFEPVAP